MGQYMRFWYLSHMPSVKAQMNLSIHTALPKPQGFCWTQTYYLCGSIITFTKISPFSTKKGVLMIAQLANQVEEK